MRIYLQPLQPFSSSWLGFWNLSQEKQNWYARLPRVIRHWVSVLNISKYLPDLKALLTLLLWHTYCSTGHVYCSTGCGSQPYKFRNQPLWPLRKHNHSRLRFILLKLMKLMKEIYLDCKIQVLQEPIHLLLQTLRSIRLFSWLTRLPLIRDAFLYRIFM